MKLTKTQARRQRRAKNLLKFSQNNLQYGITSWDDKNIPHELKKYYYQRHSLFSKFDDGIHIDYQGWYSVTPEKVAIHIANRMKCDVVIDAFCGVGGNSIQFARNSVVIAIDIDETRLECAKQNASIYGLTDKIHFIHGDFMKLNLVDLVKDLEIQPSNRELSIGVFLSPPWGGVDYHKQEFRIQDMVIDGVEIFNKCKELTNNICYFLPRNTRVEDLLDLGDVEVERCFLDDREKSLNFYFGDLKSEESEY